MGMYGTKTMGVVRLIIQQTGTYNAQYRRPYTTQLTQQTADLILDTVSQKNTITAATVAQAASGFITPMATAEQEVGILNGWQTPRLRFLLEVRSEDHMGVALTEYITGYTEYSDLSMSNLIDPKMTFFINNISMTRNVTHRTPLGTQTYQNVLDNSHILVNDQFTNMFDTNKMYSLKPENILSDMETSGILDDDLSYYDTTTTLTKAVPTKANRKNNIAPVYVASMLDAYLQTSRSEDYATHSALIEGATRAVESSTYVDDPFLTWMQARKAQRGFGIATGNMFTLEDLCALDPNTTNVMRLANRVESTAHQVGQTSGWGGSDGFTHFAATLSQALPAYMSQFCFTKVHFTSTNYSINGEIATIIADAKGYNATMDISRDIASFVFRMNNELLSSLSFNNTMPFQLEVRCDLLGETWIDVSLNGEPSVMYVTPSFTDALMTPIVTTNQNIIHGISRDFGGLMSAMVEHDQGNRGLTRSSSNIQI